MTLQATVENDGAKTLGLDSHTWSETFGWIARFFILVAIVIAPWPVSYTHLTLPTKA